MSDVYVIEATSVEWVYVITKLINRHKPKPEDVRIGLRNGHPVYQIRRTLFKPEDLAKAIGVPVDDVGHYSRIELRPLEPVGPTPTVRYYGEA